MKNKELTSLLRAAKPRPTSDEARRLDQRFADILDENGRGKVRLLDRLSPSLRGALIPVTSFACLLLVGGAIALSNLPVDNSVRTGNLDQARPAIEANQQNTASNDSLGKSTVDTVEPRQVERDASLTVRVDDVFAATRRASGMVAASSGIVLSSNLNQSGGDVQSEMALSVPSDKAAAVVSQLANLGKVEQRNQTATDVTDSYNESALRLEELRAERSSLLRQLAAAKSSAEQGAIKGKIADNRNQIEEASRSLSEMKKRTSQATISLTLMSEKAASIDDGSFGFSDALAQASGIFSTVAAYGLFALLLALPLIIGYAIFWTIRRRRRGY